MVAVVMVEVMVVLAVKMAGGDGNGVASGVEKRREVEGR